MKKILIILGLMFLAAGCDNNGQTYMSNTEIIQATKNCQDAGLGTQINYWGKNSGYDGQIYNVQCKPK